MVLTFDGEIEVKGKTTETLMKELLDTINDGLEPGYYPAGTSAWTLHDGNKLSLLTTQYHDDDIQMSLDSLSEYLTDHSLSADGSVEYYGDYRGEYAFDNSSEYEENDIDDSDFENEWDCDDDDDDDNNEDDDEDDEEEDE